MNEMQKRAIFQVEGPLLILAGAGSGKTTVIVNRIANIIKYGNAYKSSAAAYEPSEKDVELMQKYLDGDESAVLRLRICFATTRQGRGRFLRSLSQTRPRTS